jgi:NTP pyrophosphatase (non-canonical NTP hydrolase)
MHFSEFQRRAAETDQSVGDDGKGMLVALLGLAGEVGTLLSEYKKLLRDGCAHQRFDEQVSEDLGDLLWYVASTATRVGLDLDDIAARNLKKVSDRWPARDSQPVLFELHRSHLLDDAFPKREQLPRQFEVHLEETQIGSGARVVVRCEGKQIGDSLTDNARADDGYRYHDVFHLSYAAVLGWSPITRKLLNVKRKSNEIVDAVEDGARAGIIEELISQLVFQYARDHNYLEGVTTLDYHLLKTIHALVHDREVSIRRLHEWEAAILRGYRVWREVYKNRGGTVRVDLMSRSISYISPSLAPT